MLFRSGDFGIYGEICSGKQERILQVAQKKIGVFVEMVEKNSVGIGKRNIKVEKGGNNGMKLCSERKFLKMNQRTAESSVTGNKVPIIR